MSRPSRPRRRRGRNRAAGLRSASRRWRVVDAEAGLVGELLGGDAGGSAPRTGKPAAWNASVAARRAVVLPAPASPTTQTTRSALVATVRSIAAWSRERSTAPPWSSASAVTAGAPAPMPRATSVERGLLDSDQLGRRVAGGPAGRRLLADRLDAVDRLEACRDLADPVGAGTLDVSLGPGHHELGLGERGPPSRSDPSGPSSRCAISRQVARGSARGLVPRRALPRARPPQGRARPRGRASPRAADRGRRAPCARASRRLRSGRRGSRRCSCSAMCSTICARRCRELEHDLARDAFDVGHALRRRLPLDAKRARELGTKLRLVEVAGREPVGLQDRLAVERAPLAVARALCHVGDEDVRVQVRVLGADWCGAGRRPRRSPSRARG